MKQEASQPESAGWESEPNLGFTAMYLVVYASFVSLPNQANRRTILSYIDV